MKQAAKETFDSNIHHHDTRKTITKAYLSNLECSVQETVYHLLSKLNLREIFLAVYSVITNLLEERVQVLLSKKNLKKYQTIAQIFARYQIFIVI